MKLIFALLIASLAHGAAQRGALSVQEYTYDFAVSGVGSGTISLSALSKSIPTSAVVESLSIHVQEPLATSDSATLTVGSTNDPDGYLTDTNAASFTDNYVKSEGELAGALLWDDSNDTRKLHLVDEANDGDFVMTIGTGDITAGKISFWLKFYRPITD